MATMTPPDALLADHERLQAYFGQALTIIDKVNELREGGDLNAPRLELQGLEQPNCQARQSFESGDFKKAVAIFFTVGPGACGDMPF